VITITVSSFDSLLGSKTFPKKPASCPHCYSRDIKDIEVLGAYNGPLFWECGTCGVQLLRFSKTTTNKHLKKVKDLFFDMEEDWMDYICEESPN
tara:strand:- start:563 stop:844 length:282 start_codon:yes stop_codon:yes gene_type:complete